MEIYQVNKFLAFILPVQNVKSFPCIHLRDIQFPSVIPRICQDIRINAVHIKTQLRLLTLISLEYMSQCIQKECVKYNTLKRGKKQTKYCDNTVLIHNHTHRLLVCFLSLTCTQEW